MKPVIGEYYQTKEGALARVTDSLTSDTDPEVKFFIGKIFLNGEWMPSRWHPNGIHASGKDKFNLITHIPDVLERLLGIVAKLRAEADLCVTRMGKLESNQMLLVSNTPSRLPLWQRILGRAS